MGQAFWGCSNLEVNATDAPDLEFVTNTADMFRDCHQVNADFNHWDVSSVVFMSRMFQGSTQFNGNISDWDVSSVTQMTAMFQGASAFNQPIGNWDVSSVSVMDNFFSQAISFNQNLNNWNVSQVVSTVHMFEGADAYNQPMDLWDVSSVETMVGMFRNATSFNGSIGSWNLSSLTTTANMFSGASDFNQPIGDWDVSSVQVMRHMFAEARDFNQPIGDWDVSGVTSMNSMFRKTGSFNQPIGNWDVRSVSDMEFMFMESEAFNQPLENWDVSQVLNLRSMFSRASAFDQSLGTWRFNESADLTQMLNESGLSCEQYDQSLMGWNNNPNAPRELELGARSQTYYNAENARDSLINLKGWTINGDKFDYCIYDAGLPFITIWQTDLPGESDDNQILIPATGHRFSIEWEEVGNSENNVSQIAFGETLLTFPHPGTYQVSIRGHLSRITFSDGGDAVKILSIEQWGDTPWTSMNRAFFGCSNLTINALDTPDVSRVTDMYSAFRNCFNLEGEMRGWDVSNVTDMGSMFNFAQKFNGDISDWDVSSVTYMAWMFNCAASFNAPIGNWDVSSVTDMRWMFTNGRAFNQPIGNWDVSSVKRMPFMFTYATSFNQPLGDWDVSSVTNMWDMFYGASSFNQPIDNWDVSNVEQFWFMFFGATSFDQTLESWELNSAKLLEGMLSNTAINCENYDRTLIGWNTNPNLPDSLCLGAWGRTYWLGQSARDSLINQRHWVIGGDSFYECNYLDCELETPEIILEGHPILCPGDSIQLTAFPPDNQYIWLRDGMILANETGQQLTVFEPGLYTVQYTDSENCLSEESAAVELKYLDQGGITISNASDTLLRSNLHGCKPYAHFEAELYRCGTLTNPEEKIHWKIDLFNNGVFDLNSNNPGPNQSARNPLIISEEIPFGTHRVKWIYTDSNGSQVIGEHLITITDRNPPTPVCLHGLTANIHPGTGEVQLPAWIWDAGSWDDCTDKDNLTFSFSSDTNHTFHSWDCDDLDGMLEKIIVVEIWVTNDLGNQSFCRTYLNLRDNQGYCQEDDHPTAGLSGRVFNERRESMEEVEIRVYESDNQLFTTSKTDKNGFFRFELPIHQNYNLKGYVDDHPLNGVTTMDILLIHRHLLGIEPLTTPLSLIAADVNKDGQIDVLDISQIQQLILGNIEEFPQSKPWEVIQNSFGACTPTYPGVPRCGITLPTHEFQVAIHHPNKDITDFDFIAIKTGDVNASHRLPGSPHSDERSTEIPYVFKIEDLEIHAGDRIEVPVKADASALLYGFQGSWEFDPQALYFDGFEGGLFELSDANWGFHSLSEGVMTMSKAETAGITPDKGEILFTLIFEAKRGGRLNQLLNFGSTHTRAEAYTRDEVHDISLRFSGSSLSKDSVILYPSRPNPFSRETSIGFDLPESSRANLTIYDLNGKPLLKIEDYFPAGFSEIIVRQSDLGASGTYFVRLETDWGVETSRVVLIK